MAHLPAANAVRAAFADQGVKLPLRLSDEDVGVILDDDGADVLTVDSNGMRDEQKVQMIAALVATAVNDLAGFDFEPSRRSVT